MADTAAHLVDRVLPDVPLRQWVLTFPFRLRFLLAYDTGLCRSVRRTCMRALLTFLRRRARRLGIRDGQSGAVCSLQRAGGSANLNVHFHVLALDGVFFESAGSASLEFRWLKGPTESEVLRLLETIRARVNRVLRRVGLGDPTAVDEDGSEVAGCLVGAGRAQPLRVGREPVPREPRIDKRRCAEFDGYSLHADSFVSAGEVVRRERLARYITRPSIASERLSLTDDGNVLYRLRTSFEDGTTALSFQPLDFIARVAALIPPPRFHLVTYHGVLAPNHAWRSSVIPRRPTRCRRRRRAEGAALRPRRLPWADLLRRIFAFQVLRCDRCHSRKKIIAAITERAVIQKFLDAIQLPSEPPYIHPARSDPLLF